MTEQQILTDHSGALLVIRMNRGRALNALSESMVVELKKVLVEAFADASVKTIWLESAVEKAFCAGGDVKALTIELDSCSLPLQKANAGRRYFQEEYALDLMIEQSPKPIVVFSNGITYGGGWGLYAGGNLKLATANARFAMPENQIGLFPDVGAAYFLQHPDWRTGTFIGLGGFPLSAEEAMALDYVDDLISLDYAEVLKQQLSQGLDISELDIQSANTEVNSIHVHWREAMTLLDEDATLSDWLAIAEQHPEYEPFKRAALHWQTASAWSLALTWEYFRRCRSLNRAAVLAEDLTVGCYCCTHPDFYEGVHAKLVDKNRLPEWKYAHVESVPLEDLELAFNFNKNNNE